ncbi:hypothetical protein Tco_1512518 [Tanacetum coccineum]
MEERGKGAAPIKALVLMISQKGCSLKNRPVEEDHSNVGEITFLPLLKTSSADPVIIKAYISRRQVNRVYIDSGSSFKVIYEHCFLKLKPSIRSLRVDSKIPLIGFSKEHSWPLGGVPLDITIGEVSTIHGAIKFHTPKGIGTILSEYKPHRIDEGQEETNKTSKEDLKDILSCVDAEERIIVNNQYPEQTIAIGRQLPTNTKIKLQDLLKANSDVFA